MGRKRLWPSFETPRKRAAALAITAKPLRGDDGSAWGCASLQDTENLPRLGRAGDVAAGAAGARGQRLDQLAVRGHLAAVGEIERVLEARAQMAAQFGAALVQRPD